MKIVGIVPKQATDIFSFSSFFFFKPLILLKKYYLGVQFKELQLPILFQNNLIDELCYTHKTYQDEHHCPTLHGHLLLSVH